MKNSAKLLDELVKKRQENLQLLIKWSFEDLYDIKKRYYEAYEFTNSELLYEKYSQVDEAITIKIGNEEQAWDYLS